MDSFPGESTPTPDQQTGDSAHRWPDPVFDRDEEGHPSPHPRGNQEPDMGDLEKGKLKLDGVLGW